MTIENKLLEYFTNLEIEFHLRYATPPDKTGRTNVHEIRVNLKKQLAFIKLLSILDKKLPIKAVRKPFRSYMKNSGQLRDLEVQLKLVQNCEEKLQIKPGFSRWLAKEERSMQKALRLFEKKFSLVPLREESSRIKEYIHKLAGRIDLWCLLNGYFIGQLDLVRQSVEAYLDKSQVNSLHDLRTEVKELMLNLLVLQQLAPRRKKLKWMEGYLDELQHLLGRWHDVAITLSTAKQQKRRASKKLRQDLKEKKYDLQVEVATYLDQFQPYYRDAMVCFHQVFAHPEMEMNEAPPVPALVKKFSGVKISAGQKNLGEGMK